MPPPDSGEFALHEISIRIEGSDNPITFTSLSISQQLASTCSFSFIWRTEQNDANFSTHVDFYRANLGKEVTITVGDSFTFKGLINGISWVGNGELAAEYQISGVGLFAKLDEVEECNSFYHKPLSEIFNSLNTQNTTLRLSPTNTSQLFYHVQYNSTTFNFYRMLATRYGEWLYYTGEELVLGAPGNDIVELRNGTDVQNLHINAAMRKASVAGVGYDQYSGEVLRNTPSSDRASGMIGASTEAGDATFGSNHTGRRVSTAPTNDLLREMNTLMKRAAAASTVYLEGSTRNPLVKLGGKIRIVDGKGNSEGEYIITQVQHSASTSSNYNNHFVAIPADVQVPPYTNPLVYPVCAAQQAVVVDNVDADGLDRIKVRFPWMQNTETSPWISVMVPYAGNGRGMRFIPEIDEEVMIDFVDNNAERPIMIGSFYTTNNQSGIAHEGNNIKRFGSRSGREFRIDDEAGTIGLYDYSTDGAINALDILSGNGGHNLIIQTMPSDGNRAVVELKNDESLDICLDTGGIQARIKLNKDGPEIEIMSKGKIKINADSDINLNAGGNITMKATGKVNIEGTQGVKIKGMELKAEADTTFELKGLSGKVEGSADLTVKGGAMLTADGGAMATLKGGIVMIN